MKLLRKLFGLMTAEDFSKEQLELVTKAGRRCAHDLAHAASMIKEPAEQEMFHERAYMWLAVFYPGSDGKNYRSRLHRQLDEQQVYIERLEDLLEKAQIEHKHLDPRMPF